MAKRITEYTNIETIAESDVLPIVDVSDTEQASTGSTRKGTVGKIADYIKDRAETLTNKILTTARLNTPKINEDVTVTATSTELNKLDGMAGDAVGTTDTQTLTNKTIDGDDNTLSDISPSSIKGGLDGWIPAEETWTYASADDPTFTFTVASDVTGKYSAGMKIKLTQGTVKYFIITAVSTYSGGNTTITVYGGTDYDLENAAITSPYYSMMRCPQGFPMSPDKWSMELADTTLRSQSNPVQNTWYNLGGLSISLPIGVWKVSYSAPISCYKSTAAVQEVHCTLSTTTSSETDTSFTTLAVTNATKDLAASVTASKYLEISTDTTYYLLIRTNKSGIDALYFLNNRTAKTIIKATCAYL